MEIGSEYWTSNEELICNNKDFGILEKIPNSHYLVGLQYIMF